MVQGVYYNSYVTVPKNLNLQTQAVNITGFMGKIGLQLTT